MQQDVIIYLGGYDPASPPEALLGEAVRVSVCRTPEELSARLKELKVEHGYFVMKTTAGTHLLEKERIVACHAQGHRFIVYLSDGRELTSRTSRTSFSQNMVPLSRDGRFFQCSSSAVVNLAFVESARDSSLNLTNGMVLNYPSKWHIKAQQGWLYPG